MACLTTLRLISDPGPELAGRDVHGLLANLGGPACLFFNGEDPTRTRAVVTLLHGNEPSGVMALHRLLCEGFTPRVNLAVIVASTEVALTEPRFSYRMLAGHRDLNRCFRPPFDDGEGRLARAILDQLDGLAPEAVIDIHNTSGSGPAFGVCTGESAAERALVSWFSHRLVVSQLSLGALMEISDSRMPVVTIEVGGREDVEAHELAFEGLVRFAMADSVLSEPRHDPLAMEIFAGAIRLELLPDVTLAYASEAVAGYDLTLRQDIEHFNFGEVSPTIPLGWVQGGIRDVCRAVDADGLCAVDRLIQLRDGVMYPADPQRLFMVTTNPEIARSDCLYYSVPL